MQLVPHPSETAIIAPPPWHQHGPLEPHEGGRPIWARPIRSPVSAWRIGLVAVGLLLTAVVVLVWALFFRRPS